MSLVQVPLIIRGEIIEDYEKQFGGRGGDVRFETPDVLKYIDQVVNNDPISLSDLYTISMDEIVDFLSEVHGRLDLEKNRYWREAFEVSCLSSNLSRPVLEAVYRACPGRLEKTFVRDFIEARFGWDYLEGWVPRTLQDGRTINVRAMGARAAHVIAGNVPGISVTTLLRSAITRSDTIVKLPSNDLLTMGALARTMIEIDPKHPLTRHLTVGYWKGGDEAVESEIYQPANLEKVVAWGGFSSVKHISKYLQPGIDLITLDPKSSTTLIGREALVDDKTMRDVAYRAAIDMGSYEQEGCANARVIFLESGVDAAGVAAANRFGQYMYEGLKALPKSISNGALRFDPVLKSEIQSILSLKEFYQIYCDPKAIEKGGVIVSQLGEQVDFNRLLYGRVGNLVPVDNIEDALETFTAATQTVGVYPDSLRVKLRDRAALRGGQMMVPLGYAVSGSICGPLDGIETERRMCRWVVDSHFPDKVWRPEPETAEVAA